MESQAHTLKPYLIQAVYNWCLDSNLTPYLEIVQFEKNKLPAHLSQGRKSVVFNISKRGASKFTFLPEGIQFKTKINQKIEVVFVNYHGVKKIYAKELGHGLDFSTDFVNNESVEENIEDYEEEISKGGDHSLEEQDFSSASFERLDPEDKEEPSSLVHKKTRSSTLEPDSKLFLVVNNQKNKDKDKNKGN